MLGHAQASLGLAERRGGLFERFQACCFNNLSFWYSCHSSKHLEGRTCVSGADHGGTEKVKGERQACCEQVYIIYELGVALKRELNLSELNCSLNY